MVRMERKSIGVQEAKSEITEKLVQSGERKLKTKGTTNWRNKVKGKLVVKN